MQVRAEAPHVTVTVEAETVPQRLMTAIQDEFAPDQITIREGDNEVVDFRDADWYREVKANLTPGTAIRIYRENKGWSQAELTRRIGASSRTYVYALRAGRKGISVERAKRIAAVLEVPVWRIIDPTRID